MSDSSYYHGLKKEVYPYIPQNITKTLDVGCAAGVFSEALKKERGVEAWGIEMVDKCIDEARSRLDNVLHGTFEDVYTQLPKAYFDCVFFNDVLEHMPYPEDCLAKVKENIKSGGYVLASIPNIRHISIVRSLLLNGEWKYEDSGIMDRTHLRFFTKKSMIRMFADCGYKIEMIRGVNGVGRFSLTSILNALTFNSLNDFKYRQYLVLARPI